MTRLSLLLVVAAACGGSPKPTPTTTPLPDDTKQAAPPVAQAPAPAPAVKSPAPPPPPAGPLDIKIPALQTTVKLVSGGKGKKEAMRYALKEGAKQAVELALDFSGRQDTEEQGVPTIVLSASAETKAVGKDGTAEYTLTVTSTDAREVAGVAVDMGQFKHALEILSGLTIGGTVGANGAAGDVTLHMENPPPHAARVLDLIRMTLPRLPVLPTEAVGVGARWQATTSAKLADRLDITQITDYELIAHKGSTWTIKGTSKVSGKDQDIETSKVSEITGTGTSEATIDGGALYPTLKSSIETQFKASEKDKSVKFTLKIGSAVTPKDAAAAPAAKGK
ncbi:MAG TPA: DUF6263 family protein [Kofleriaceae bacterium]|jgi:hypothetical protein|nr:DUF6263 family protein [Kofleriaceae bacterium]